MTTRLELRGATRDIAAAARHVAKRPEEGDLERLWGACEPGSSGTGRLAVGEERLGASCSLLPPSCSSCTWRMVYGSQSISASGVPGGWGRDARGLLHSFTPGKTAAGVLFGGQRVALAGDTRMRIVAVDEHGEFGDRGGRDSSRYRASGGRPVDVRGRAVLGRRSRHVLLARLARSRSNIRFCAFRRVSSTFTPHGRPHRSLFTEVKG